MVVHMSQKTPSSPFSFIRGTAKNMLTDEAIAEILKLTGQSSHPNMNALITKVRNIDAMAMTLKYFGYELARSLADALPVRQFSAPLNVDLKSKPSTQADIESDWVAYWCGKLQIPVVFHRKIWELCYVLQAVQNAGFMKEGSRGLGFGCGEEPLPSLMAANGVKVTVTDLPPEESQDRGWSNTAQYTASIDHAFKHYLVDRPTFDRNVDLKFVDMNKIPNDLVDYDFCWSICALEHIGSIAQGLDFIENSLNTLRPGGLAVHTTEFNFMNDNETIDNWPTVLFQRKHFSMLADRLRSKGHFVAELDFDVGSKPLDRFIDMPPWSHDLPDSVKTTWGSDSAHIKLNIDGFPCTCFGMIVRKAQ